MKNEVLKKYSNTFLTSKSNDIIPTLHHLIQASPILYAIASQSLKTAVSPLSHSYPHLLITQYAMSSRPVISATSCTFRNFLLILPLGLSHVLLIFNIILSRNF
jgi:hypothetical protein